MRNVTLLSSVPCSGNNIYTALKIRSEFHNVSVTVGVVDGLVLHGLALHGKLLRPRLEASTRDVLVDDDSNFQKKLR